MDNNNNTLLCSVSYLCTFLIHCFLDDRKQCQHVITDQFVFTRKWDRGRKYSFLNDTLSHTGRVQLSVYAMHLRVVPLPWKQYTLFEWSIPAISCNAIFLFLFSCLASAILQLRQSLDVTKLAFSQFFHYNHI